jgi:Cu/Ag efflux protein CusF
VSSVNGKVGTVTMVSTDVSAASAVHTHVVANVTDFASGVRASQSVSSVAGRTGTVTLTTADISDLNTANLGSVFSVNGRTGTVTLVASDVSAASATHSHDYLQSLNGQTGTLVVAGGDNITVTTTAGVITITGKLGGDVFSVNGKTGTVTLTTTDISAAPASHTHVAANITDFVTEAAKVGPVAGVNGMTGTVVLVATDVSAASASHTHVAANITDFVTEAAKVGPVASVGGQTGAVTIVAGSGVTITTSVGVITIAGNTASGGGGSSLPTTANVATVTVTQNNWDIGTADISFIYSGSTATLNITGIATSTALISRLVINGSTHTGASFTVKHNDTNSTASLRILSPWQGDYVLSPNGGAMLLVSDPTQGRTRIV